MSDRVRITSGRDVRVETWTASPELLARIGDAADPIAALAAAFTSPDRRCVHVHHAATGAYRERTFVAITCESVDRMAARLAEAMRRPT